MYIFFYARELLAGDTSLAVNLSPDHIFFPELL